MLAPSCLSVLPTAELPGVGPPRQTPEWAPHPRTLRAGSSASSSAARPPRPPPASAACSAVRAAHARSSLPSTCTARATRVCHCFSGQERLEFSNSALPAARCACPGRPPAGAMSVPGSAAHVRMCTVAAGLLHMGSGQTQARAFFPYFTLMPAAPQRSAIARTAPMSSPCRAASRQLAASASSASQSRRSSPSGAAELAAASVLAGTGFRSSSPPAALPAAVGVPEAEEGAPPATGLGLGPWLAGSSCSSSGLAAAPSGCAKPWQPGSEPGSISASFAASLAPSEDWRSRAPARCLPHSGLRRCLPPPPDVAASPSAAASPLGDRRGASHAPPALARVLSASSAASPLASGRSARRAAPSTASLRCAAAAAACLCALPLARAGCAVLALAALSLPARTERLTSECTEQTCMLPLNTQVQHAGRRPRQPPSLPPRAKHPSAAAAASGHRECSRSDRLLMAPACCSGEQQARAEATAFLATADPVPHARTHVSIGRPVRCRSSLLCTSDAQRPQQSGTGSDCL